MIHEDLKGKNVIVTGASRRAGIGAAICHAFAAQGSNVFFTAYSSYDAQMAWGADEGGADELLAELWAAGVKAAKLEVDLSTPDAAEKVLEAASAAIGEPDVLVNNATYSTRDGFEKLDAATLDAHYAVNMRGAFLLSVEFAKGFTKGTGGRVINLSSGQGTGPMPGELAYAATKGAVEAFTRTLAFEVAPLGITVNAVDPGATDTGWMTPEVKRALADASQFGRVGTPEDAARLVVFLASEVAQWLTGQVVHSRGI